MVKIPGFRIFNNIPIYEYILFFSSLALGFCIGWLEWGNDWEELPSYTLMGCAFYVTARAFYYFMTLGLSKSNEVPAIVQEKNEIIVNLVTAQRDRARKLKISGRFILLAIVLSIASGIQVFYYADSAARANSAELQLGQLTKDFENIVGLRSRFSRSSDDLKAESLNEILNKVRSVVSSETDRFIKNSKANPQEVIISALSTRIGIIFLLIFLVQILVTMYRYSIKLAALYDSRADMLQLLPPDEKLNFEKLTLLTSTENVDFSKQDKAPADYALELAKKIIDKSGK